MVIVEATEDSVDIYQLLLFNRNIFHIAVWL